jgi:hypothetical protein
VHAGLQYGVAGQIVRGVRVVKRERFLVKIKHIDRATGSPKLLGNVTDNDARHRVSLQAADDGQNV